jgi:hypothetical protein
VVRERPQAIDVDAALAAYRVVVIGRRWSPWAALRRPTDGPADAHRQIYSGLTHPLLTSHFSFVNSTQGTPGGSRLMAGDTPRSSHAVHLDAPGMLLPLRAVVPGLFTGSTPVRGR